MISESSPKTKKKSHLSSVENIIWGSSNANLIYVVWKQHFEQCDITYIELHQTVDWKKQCYWLYIVSFRTFHFYFLTHIPSKKNCIIAKLWRDETNTKFTFLQIGCCIMQWVLSPTRKDNDAETYEIYYDINIFLHSHLATQEAVLRLITNELYLICMLLITDDACS